MTGCNSESTKLKICSVGLLLQETIGLPLTGINFLWIFVSLQNSGMSGWLRPIVNHYFESLCQYCPKGIVC